ncbi:putative polypeptide N-acetylgalactosaminyltransferase 9 [Lucilia cuprina]|uniref:putative polypeptide N-acetylgalactosaminyltransferase 9 n=1 Tax=Lucilia cuprina TaxID=7375 RepID=UPI001F055F1F|nr:putative polypeptide N-acetylgalactosaminyltransferase 9 [Lucilia cuprina]
MYLISLQETNMCLQAKDDVGNVDIKQCNNKGGKQFWMFTDIGEIRKDETCLTANETNPILTYCDDDRGENAISINTKQWFLNNSTNQISNNNTKQCLAVSPNRDYILMENCRKKSWRQRWILI